MHMLHVQDWFKQLWLLWTLLFAAAVCVSCQELTSTLCEGSRACQGEEVIFTCTIRGPSSSQVIVVAWSSAEYIGQGGSLQLSTANMIGDVQTSTGMDGNITAIAIVTNNSNVNGELVLESTLTITAVVASTVICRSANGGAASIEFTILAVPGIPQRVRAVEISRASNGICIILVTWNPPANSDASDIDQYIVYVPSRNIRDDTSSSTISTLTVSNCGDDIRVQVAAVNRISCVGMNSSEVQPILLDIPATTTKGGCTSTSKASLMAPTTGTANLISVFSSIIIIMCAISSIVFLSIGCACGWFGHKHKQSRTRKAISNSPEENNLRHIEGSEHSQTPGPLYEELQQRSTSDHQDLVELKENVAYGPIV